MKDLALNAFTDILNYLRERKVFDVAEGIEAALKRRDNSHFSNRTEAVKDASKSIVLLKNAKMKMEKQIDLITDQSLRTEAKEKLKPLMKSLFDDPLQELRKHKKHHSCPREEVGG